jgi:hypothetical protein
MSGVYEKNNKRRERFRKKKISRGKIKGEEKLKEDKFEMRGILVNLHNTNLLWNIF